MAGCFYNGVLLPEIPSDALKNYPYCWIRNNTRTGYYDLMMAKSPWWQSDSTTIYTASYADGIQWYRTPITAVGDDWTFNQSWTTNGGMADESDRNIIWANQNIPTGAVTATTIYFVGSSAVPDVESYQIKKDTVVAIADQVRRLCKTEDTMTPAVIENKLGGLNIELEETYVISTGKEQTILPDEGYYGFSKITVGAVDVGGGSGGSGDDGESEVVEYPDAEVTTFGTEYVIVQVPVGELSYIGTDGNVYTLPALPDVTQEDYPYCWMTKNFTDDTLCTQWLINCASAEPVAEGNVMHAKSSKQYLFDKNESDLGWQSTVVDGVSSGTLLKYLWWTNFDVKDADGNVVFSAGQVSETTVGVSVPRYATREPIYTITSDTLNELATEIQKITGGSLMSPAQMISVISSLADDSGTSE